MAENASRLRHEGGQRREERGPRRRGGQGHQDIARAHAPEVVGPGNDPGHPFCRSGRGTLSLEETMAARSAPAPAPVELLEEDLALALLRWVPEIGLGATN